MLGFHIQEQAEDYNYRKLNIKIYIYSGADKSLAWPGRKQATATEDFDFRISYL